MDYFEVLTRWQELQQVIPRLQAEERALRENLFKGTFQDPREGVNTVEMPDGRKLKGTYVLYRSLKGDAWKTSLPETLGQRVVATKYELKVSEYKKLNDEERRLVDGVIEIKPGLPKLEVVDAKAE